MEWPFKETYFEVEIGRSVLLTVIRPKPSAFGMLARRSGRRSIDTNMDEHPTWTIRLKMDGHANVRRVFATVFP